jgi:catalase
MQDGRKMTGNFGSPVGEDRNSMSAGTRGPVLMQDIHLTEKLAHFDRERIPERVVHAKGAGAFGYFEVTNDLSKYTKAKFLSKKGKKTEVFVRFSTVGGEKGSADAERDPRGFAVKFYTEEGNYDLVGNNTPVFFIRDALQFPDFIHTQKRNPETNLKDPDMFWDFLSLTPESVHQVTILFSDRGIPRTYRHMDGFGSHTFMWYNEKNDYWWIKYHFKTQQGIENLTRQEADKIKGLDPDHATRDLFESIKNGDFPKWKLSVQIMTPDQADMYHIDPFDVTKVWPHADFPLIELGTLVLNKNPDNYFAEVEQAAFAPANFVPGIGPSPDKLLQGRLFSYHDTQRHRLGPNFHLIPVNAPKGVKVINNERDGAMNTGGNSGATPSYSPNTMNGVVTNAKTTEPHIPVEGTTGRYAHNITEDDFIQAGELYRHVMTEDERTRLVDNIVQHIKHAEKRLQLRQTAHFFRADPDYGRRVALGLGLSMSEVERLAHLTLEQEAAATV